MSLGQFSKAKYPPEIKLKAAAALELRRRASSAPLSAPTWRGAAAEAQTTTAREWIISGPYECVAGETRLYDPLTGRQTPIVELCERGEPITVLTMHGTQTVNAPFAKGYAALYRVTMASERSFIATARHRLLTARGWTCVADLEVGLSVPSSSPIPLASNSGDDQARSPLDARHLSRTLRDCRDGYSAYSHPCDGQPLGVGGGDLASALLQVDARVHSYDDHDTGDRVLSQEYSHLGQQYARLSIGHYERRYGQPACDRFPAFAKTQPPDVEWNQCAPLSLEGLTPQHSTLSPALRDDDTRPASVPYDNSFYTVHMDTVSSITYVRTDYYYDLHVPDAEHYYAEGYWHHNTGKTWAALYRLDTEARSTPGGQYAIVRKVRADMDGSVLVTWGRIIAQRGGVSTFGGNKPQWYDYPNGARVWVGGLDRPEKTLSGERDGIYVNQAEELEEHDWETIGTRTTGRGAVSSHPMLFGDCNPGAEDHWIIRRRDAGILTLLESRHEDNPALHNGETWTEQGERTMAILDALTGIRYQRGRLGRWVGAEGMYFTQLHPDIHLVEQDRQGGWPVWGALDYGFSHPLSFGIFTQSPPGTVYLLARHAACKWYISQHAAAMDGLLEQLGIEKQGLRIVAGHDCWATGHDDPETIAEKFAAEGYYLERAIISRVIGARAVGERLGNPESGVLPSFFIDKRRARPAFDSLARMVHDPRNTEDVLKINADAEGRGGDDDYDMIRYGLMAASQATTLYTPPPGINRWKAL